MMNKIKIWFCFLLDDISEALMNLSEKIGAKIPEKDWEDYISND